MCKELRQDGRHRQGAGKPAGEQMSQLLLQFSSFLKRNKPIFSVSLKEFMPFREIYTTAFKHDVEYSQLVLQTAVILQSHKFVQVTHQKEPSDSVKFLLPRRVF